MSNYREFSKELWALFEKEIDRHLKTQGSPHYAAFDADGTLWDIDAGEAFFKYQIDHSNLEGLPTDPWLHYHQWKERDPRAAYLWLAQISSGQSLAQVRQWARECRDQQPNWPIFPAQKKLVQYFRSKGIRVFVVTASIKWAVEPFAELLGLHFDDVIGVETQIKNGIVTDQLSGRITWKEGKSETLLERTQGIPPLFCSGNTMGDASLIECSQLLKLAVRSTRDGDELFETELSLQKMARENNWQEHSFLKP
jgi:HAD superfamily phosphoserine phosphatase-like hydrolase